MDYGTVVYNKNEYILVEQADFTNRLLPNSNYHDAADGEEYEFEMGANAIDAEGNKYFVTYIFTNIKGQGAIEIDAYDYSVATDVTIL